MSDANNLHGCAPDKAGSALLLIDVINAMDFPGGEDLLRYAWPAAQRIAELRERARAARVPVIYVNDNFGRWRSDFRHNVRHCLQAEMPGQRIVKLLQPDEDDYFVLKPKHSAFYSTTLDLLLKHLQARHLVLTGFAGNLCVLYTANDAYMRDYKIAVPSDCIASEDKCDNDHALEQMKRQLKADIRPAAEIKFDSDCGKAERVAEENAER